jgi:hypothetical protein
MKLWAVVEWDDDIGQYGGNAEIIGKVIEMRVNGGEWLAPAKVTHVLLSNPAMIPPDGERPEDIPAGYELFAPVPTDTPYERGHKLGVLRQFNLQLTAQAAARGSCTFHVRTCLTATTCARCGTALAQLQPRHVGLVTREEAQRLNAEFGAGEARWAMSRHWCPTCQHFFKERGLNNCHLVDWAEHPDGGRPDVRHWLVDNTTPDTVIHANADHCPGWALVAKESP